MRLAAERSDDRQSKKGFTKFKNKRLGTAVFKVEASDFLSGRVKDWKASFDWVIKPINAVKYLEGSYDNKQHAVSGVSGTEKMAAALGEFVNGN